MLRPVSIALLVLCVSACALLLSVVIRVAEFEAIELDRWSDETSLEDAAGAPEPIAIDSVFLQAGDLFDVELCADADMSQPGWEGALRVHLRAASGAAMLSQELDAALLERVRRRASASCVSIARGELDAADEGEVSIGVEVLNPGAIAGASVRSHVLSRRALSPVDRNLVLALLLASVLAMLAMGVRAQATPREAGGAPAAGSARGEAAAVAARVAAALALVVVAFYVLGQVGQGPTLGLFGGVALALVEVGVAFALARAARGERVATLGLVAPAGRARAIGAFVAAPFIGVLLFFLALAAQRAFPVDVEAPIALFVRFPSGMLSFAALAVVAPIAEEVFFRGLLYGLLRGPGGRGREVAAALGAWLLFALAHLPQDWGNWAGLASVLVAGFGFTALRAASGSTLVSCVAHLVYNGLHVALLLAPR